MIAKVTGLKPGDFVYCLGDAHVYNNHIEALKSQLERKPYPFATVSFKRDIQNIDEFIFEDFELKDYQCHESIKMKMSA
jgi:thymidylate synthase